jgi:adhesin HecA-like repeat protein
VADGGVDASAAGTLVNRNLIASSKAVNLSGGALDLGGTTISEDAIDLRASGAAAINGEVRSAKTLTGAVGEQLSVGTAGEVSSLARVDLQAGSAAIDGRILSGAGGLQVATAGALLNRGKLETTGALAVTGGSVANSGTLRAEGCRRRQRGGRRDRRGPDGERLDHRRGRRVRGRRRPCGQRGGHRDRA